MRTTAVRLVACVLALGAACDGTEPRRMGRDRIPRATPTGTETVVIGLVGTLSGPGSWRGEDAFEGADLAVHVVNRSLPEGAPRFELATLDDGGDPARAAALVRELAQAERTAGVVYAGPPRGLAGAADVLDEARVPAFICYGDLYGARLLRPSLFQVAPPFVWQARRIAAYLAEDRGYRRVGALVESSLMGRTAARALTTAFGEADAARPRVLRYVHRGFDPRELVRRLRAMRVQAVVIEGTPEVFARTLAALGAARVVV